MAMVIEKTKPVELVWDIHHTGLLNGSKQKMIEKELEKFGNKCFITEGYVLFIHPNKSLGYQPP